MYIMYILLYIIIYIINILTNMLHFKEILPKTALNSTQRAHARLTQFNSCLLVLAIVF